MRNHRFTPPALASLDNKNSLRAIRMLQESRSSIRPTTSYFRLPRKISPQLASKGPWQTKVISSELAPPPLMKQSALYTAREAARSSFLTLWIRDEENRTMHPKCFGLMVAVLAGSGKWCAGADESRFRCPHPPGDQLRSRGRGGHRNGGECVKPFFVSRHCTITYSTRKLERP